MDIKDCLLLLILSIMIFKGFTDKRRFDFQNEVNQRMLEVDSLTIDLVKQLHNKTK